MSEPWRLFRYRSVNEYLWQELELSEFYCAPPDKLNDPFDCRVDWADSLRRVLARTQLSEGRRWRLKEMLAQFELRDPRLHAGICCFSIKLDDQLMWSHYANSHQGVCLLYEIPATYFHSKYPPELRKPRAGDNPFFVGSSQVFYGDNAFSDWLLAGDLDTPLADQYVENAVARIFTCKGKCWAHEEEFRIVTSRPGSLRFCPDFLKQVTFGLAMQAQHRRLIAQLAKRSNKDVVLSEVKHSHTSDFDLIFPEAVL